MTLFSCFRAFLSNSSFQSTDEKIVPMISLSPQHFVQSTLSSTSGVSLTGPSSSLGTQLTTPSSFTKLSSVSCNESPEAKTCASGECVSPYSNKNESSNYNSCSTGYKGNIYKIA